MIFVNVLLLSLDKSGISVYMYANGIIIFSINSHLVLAETDLKNAVESVQYGSRENKLLLNPQKSYVMVNLHGTLTGTYLFSLDLHIKFLNKYLKKDVFNS